MKFGIKSARREYLEAVLVALILGLVLRTFVVQAYRIPSESMEDTLQVGDFLLVNKLIYHFRDPIPGDVIVFKYPLNPSKDYIKRVVATEGQTVEIADKTVIVDGQQFPLPGGLKLVDRRVFPANLSNRDNFGPVLVPPGHIFVLGDNRDDSRDSRTWGFLDRRFVKGKALLIYWSWAPDPNAPSWRSPYVLPFFSIVFYNLGHFPSRIRWDRVGTTL